MVSVIIAAHNEEATIGACLDALLGQDTDSALQVIVSANACSDRTAEIARERGVEVVDRPEPGKAAAMNAGERLATSFPRVYLDADIIAPPGSIAALERVLVPGICAAVPSRRIELTGRSWVVRSYFAINERLPVFRNGLFGRGMIAVSEAGRSRFTLFPEMTADDLFLDSLFTDAEKTEARSVEVVVEAPYDARNLLNRLVRVRRGNAQMRKASETGEVQASVRRSRKASWFFDVVVREPRLLPASVPYVGVTVLSALRAKRRSSASTWGRDESTRGSASR